MTASARLPVVLLWHMHQPHYRDALTGQYALPWTYLHAIKDYTDMAAHLEAHPGARAVVNFTPVLLEQLEDISRRVAAHLERGDPLPDPVLALLGPAPLPEWGAERAALMRACLRAHRQHMIERFAPYRDLAALAEPLATAEHAAYAADALIRDLAVWYHLAWMGETVRRSDVRIAALAEQGRGFTAAQRRALLALIAELLAGIMPRYRRLAEAGRCELSVTPYAHPILPLLLDFRAARESVPDSPLPRHAHYPGGAERAAWHAAESLTVFERCFALKPSGCWPAEGAVSEPALRLIEAHGLRWAASGGAVLKASLTASGDRLDEPGAFERPYRLEGATLPCWFRDDRLSDLIGFTYSSWHGDDAARNLAHELGEIARSGALAGRAVLIALDGENAWEYYPFNGYYFLDSMYALLSEHPLIELTTLSELASRVEARPLEHLVAGSWVHGTLGTWMGDAAKNAAWDLLCDAKIAYDEALAHGLSSPGAREAAQRQLALCESSDWFWWFGDYNPPETVRQFDELYRRQLGNLYRLLARPAPEALARPIAVGRGDMEHGGVMRRATAK
ncbi:MAG: glycoside hydrolase [Steroidobacteraceae bacterium]